jgi:ribosome-associated protein
MLERKAQDIVVLDLRKVKNAVADYFVICSGTSDTQLDAIADSVEEEVKKQSGEVVWHKEGKANREWILIDYVDVVAHVFKKDRRKYYDLEELWGDAQVTLIAESVA